MQEEKYTKEQKEQVKIFILEAKRKGGHIETTRELADICEYVAKEYNIKVKIKVLPDEAFLSS